LAFSVESGIKKEAKNETIIQNKIKNIASTADLILTNLFHAN
jgi:hypothetical protein